MLKRLFEAIRNEFRNDADELTEAIVEDSRAKGEKLVEEATAAFLEGVRTKQDAIALPVRIVVEADTKTINLDGETSTPSGLPTDFEPLSSMCEAAINGKARRINEVAEELNVSREELLDNLPSSITANGQWLRKVKA